MFIPSLVLKLISSLIAWPSAKSCVHFTVCTKGRELDDLRPQRAVKDPPSPDRYVRRATLRARKIDFHSFIARLDSRHFHHRAKETHQRHHRSRPEECPLEQRKQRPPSREHDPRANIIALAAKSTSKYALHITSFSR